jgi:queuine tRNA-ribosyltransferase
MPVGTRGAVKAVTHRDVRDVGAEILLANTYHLYLRPGDGVIARSGGLHRFIGWNGPILTDSGGYQIFSLGRHGSLRTIDEEGVRFRSHLDGSEHTLTPESAIAIQARLGADIAMSFDECPAFPLTSEQARRSMERTLRWAKRSRDRFLQLKAGGVPGGRDVSLVNPGQVQFGVVQGSTFTDLRQESATSTRAMGFDGYAIGGLSVGEPIELMYAITEQTASLLPEACPRYLMGAGMPDDLVEAVARGIDLFDCVLPTRNARNGQLFTRQGPLSIKLARYTDDMRPPDPECRCYTCRQFSRAYLRHLYLAREMTAATLNTLHNLHFYLDTMRQIREAIAFGTFDAFRHAFHQTFSRRQQG